MSVGYGKLVGKKERLWLPLGSGNAAKYGIGPKAALLDVARRYGLPVPAGIILVDEAWRRALGAGLVRVTDSGEVQSADMTRLVFSVGFPNFDWELPGPFAVRSAFSVEDQSKSAMAGYFESRLKVDGRDPQQLGEALCAVWQSALRSDADPRRDILIMRMVDAKHAGVAFTEHEFEDDLVNYTEGLGDKLVSGVVEGGSLSLPKLRGSESPEETLPAWAKRLQVLLRQVRRNFNHPRSGRDWDIEWADDGEKCWLLQIRPITRPTRRNEAFTIANHKEILPPLPSIFMTSLVASCAAGLFAYYRAFDRSLPANRPFIEVFNGRPYINLSLLVEMMRQFGLPSKLVTDSIGGEVERDFPPRLGRIIRKIIPLAKFGGAQLLAPFSARRVGREMLQRTESLADSFGDLLSIGQYLYTTLVTQMFSLTSAISLPLLLLRRMGVLEEHAARSRSIGTEIYTDLAPLQRLADQKTHLREALSRGELPADSDFRAAWEQYLSKHGHRGIYESDLSRPRYREQPSALFALILQPPTMPSAPPKRTLKGLLTSPIAWQANRAIRAREKLRYETMIGFERLRMALLKATDLAVRNGQLPSAAALWDLTIEEVCQLDSGWSPDAAFFAERTAEIARLKLLPVPDLLHRFDDLEAIPDGGKTSHLKGISLTSGEVQGRAWVLSEPELTPPSALEGPLILVARAVDAGWIPTFAKVMGVVVETGGDLSHGSIILRELGLPAVTNVRGATYQLKTGDLVRLKASQGVVERLELAERA